MATRKKASSTKMKKARGGITQSIGGKNELTLTVDPGVSVSITGEDSGGFITTVLKVVSGEGRVV